MQCAEAGISTGANGGSGEEEFEPPMARMGTDFYLLRIIADCGFQARRI
jgi:hypothetical protein